MEEMLQPSTPEHVIYFSLFEWDSNNQIDEKLNVLDRQPIISFRELELSNFDLDTERGWKNLPE